MLSQESTGTEAPHLVLWLSIKSPCEIIYTLLTHLTLTPVPGWWPWSFFCFLLAVCLFCHFPIISVKQRSPLFPWTVCKTVNLLGEYAGGLVAASAYPPLDWFTSAKSKAGLGLGVYSRFGWFWESITLHTHTHKEFCLSAQDLLTRVQKIKIGVVWQYCIHQHSTGVLNSFSEPDTSFIKLKCKAKTVLNWPEHRAHQLVSFPLHFDDIVDNYQSLFWDIFVLINYSVVTITNEWSEFHWDVFFCLEDYSLTNIFKPVGNKNVFLKTALNSLL